MGADCRVGGNHSFAALAAPYRESGSSAGHRTRPVRETNRNSPRPSCNEQQSEKQDDKRGPDNDWDRITGLNAYRHEDKAEHSQNEDSHENGAVNGASLDWYVGTSRFGSQDPPDSRGSPTLLRREAS